MQSHINIYLDITFQVKCKSGLIIKFKTIEYRKNFFCYLFFYLYYNFFDILLL